MKLPRLLIVPDRPSTRTEILVGRSIAACLHPFAAWGVRSGRFRLPFVVGYFVVGYLGALVALFAIGAPSVF